MFWSIVGYIVLAVVLILAVSLIYYECIERTSHGRALVSAMTLSQPREWEISNAEISNRKRKIFIKEGSINGNSLTSSDMRAIRRQADKILSVQLTESVVDDNAMTEPPRSLQEIREEHRKFHEAFASEYKL